MSKAVNYKIQKYTYKLEHAQNQKEAAIYKAKLATYSKLHKGPSKKLLPPADQRGGVVTEEEVRSMVNDAFAGSESQISALSGQFDKLIADIRAKCCEKKDCGPEVTAQIAKLEADWRELLRNQLAAKDTQLGQKLTEQRESLEAKLKEKCPPVLESVAPFQVEESPKQTLFGTESEAVPPVPAEFLVKPPETVTAATMENPDIKKQEIEQSAHKMAEALKAMEESPTMSERVQESKGEVGEEATSPEPVAKGGRKKRNTNNKNKRR
ncbi:MAG: hypothetical protein Barrevirus3_34 [Barrevirus sp.]|uniref:Uncharacterized protein n=1 Tax=Barrevirus sp. TaxID=2487763 RepID=A0A3G4ZRF5_9VIRU|nr:MAG: hypothetical protein Barrevirus3_34 [Barrevirus sp.]